MATGMRDEENVRKSVELKNKKKERKKRQETVCSKVKTRDVEPKAFCCRMRCSVSHETGRRRFSRCVVCRDLLGSHSNAVLLYTVGVSNRHDEKVDSLSFHRVVMTGFNCHKY